MSLLHTGPISAAIYILEEEQNTAMQMLSEWLIQTERNNIALHFVISKGVIYLMPLFHHTTKAPDLHV